MGCHLEKLRVKIIESKQEIQVLLNSFVPPDPYSVAIIGFGMREEGEMRCMGCHGKGQGKKASRQTHLIEANKPLTEGKR